MVDGQRTRVSEAWLAALGVLGILAFFLSFAFQYVSRATNNLWGDLAFSGWTAAVGHELACGRRIYEDFVVPLPPGPFLFLSWIERLSARGPSLLAECAVCVACHATMGILAYFIARPLVGRVNALLTSAGALGWICGWAKELAYDHLAEVCAWAALALLVASFRASEARDERRWAFLAGAAAGLGFLFKQSTATGTLASGFVGLGYFAFVERRASASSWRRARAAAAFASGALAGFLTTLAGVLVARGSIPAFFRAVFVDGPRLKGGTPSLAAKTMAGAISEPIFSSSLAGVVLVAALGARIAHRHGARVFAERAPSGASSFEEEPLCASHLFATWGVVAGTFGFGAAMLASGAKGVPPFVAALGPLGFAVTGVGAYLVVGYFFFARGERVHAYRAMVLGALAIASVVSMSLMAFQPLAENNATIVLVLATLFAGIEAGGFGRLRWLALAFVLFTPLGSKLPRALMADGPVVKSGFFRGMRVNGDGREVLRAAERARFLAGKAGTALVLPEDPSLAALIGTERPPLCGGIVFADQYPDRCLAPDLAYLSEHPPRVVVVRPTPPEAWLSVFRQWRLDAPATALIQGFIGRNVAKYRRDSTYRTRWGAHETALELWVLDETLRAGG